MTYIHEYLFTLLWCIFNKESVRDGVPLALVLFSYARFTVHGVPYPGMAQHIQAGSREEEVSVYDKYLSINYFSMQRCTAKLGNAGKTRIYNDTRTT